MTDELKRLNTDYRNSQVGGNHYTTLSIQPLDITNAMYGGTGLEAVYFNNIMKYLMRRKDNKEKRIEDFQKAVDYINRWIELEENRD